ncbi:hypothetical protein D3C85_544060 [compost metagenome]
MLRQRGVDFHRFRGRLLARHARHVAQVAHVGHCVEVAGRVRRLDEAHLAVWQEDAYTQIEVVVIVIAIAVIDPGGLDGEFARRARALFQRYLVRLARLGQRYFGQGNLGRRRRFCLRLRHFAAEIRDQRIEAAIETLAHGHEAPAPVLAVELAQHDGFFLRKIGTRIRVAGQFSAAVEQPQMAAAQLRHRGVAIDGGRDDQALDGRRQAVQLVAETGCIAGRRRGFHAATRRTGLVEESHVAVIGQLAAGVEAETGEIQRHAGAGQTQLHDIAHDEAGQRQALPLDQVFHGVREKEGGRQNRAAAPPGTFTQTTAF